MEFVGYLALIGIGIVLSLIGGGGSLLSMPILVYLFSLDVVTASSYSLFIVGTTSLLGVFLNQHEQRIDLRAGIMFCASSAVAIFSTRKWLLPWIPEELWFGDSLFVSKRVLILGVFVLLVIASSLAIILRHAWPPRERGKQRLTLLLPVSFATGIVGGFVGAGGGFIILPSLMIFGGLPFRMAVGTTLLVIAFNSLLGFLGDVMNYTINWYFLLMFTGLAAIGMLLGNHYSSRIPVYYLRLSFGWIMLIAAVIIMVKELAR